MRTPRRIIQWDISRSQDWLQGMQKQQVSTQARYFPKRNWVPAVNIHLHWTSRLVPGSCCGNGFYTSCPCLLLLASEWRHRWWWGWSGSGSVSRAWAAGKGCGAAAQQCHAEPDCSCPDALGRAFSFMVQDPQGFGKSTKTGKLIEGDREGGSSGGEHRQLVYSIGMGWLRGLACARHRRWHGEGRKKGSCAKGQAHISPTAIEGGNLQSLGKLSQESGLGYIWEIRQDYNQLEGGGQGWAAGWSYWHQQVSVESSGQQRGLGSYRDLDLECSNADLVSRGASLGVQCRGKWS